MKGRKLATAWLFGLIIVSGNAFASSAWWMLCDWCVSDSDFTNQALIAPLPHETVYVSNRQTSETRKYHRLITTEDFGDGTEQTVFVQQAPLFAGPEKAAFDQAIYNANISSEEFERTELAAALPSLGGADSVVEDIAFGSIRSGLITALGEAIDQRGLLPDRISTGTAANTDLRGVGLGLAFNETIRIKDLAITITYADGSVITVTRVASNGDFGRWEILDAEGNEIPATDEATGSGADIDAEQLEFLSSFSFGAGNDIALIQFLGFIGQNSSLQCSSQLVTGDVDRFVVTCQRP